MLGYTFYTLYDDGQYRLFLIVSSVDNNLILINSDLELNMACWNNPFSVK